MVNRHRISFIVIMALAALGVVYSILNGKYGLLIPVIVFGLVFLLLKFPPGRYRKAPKIKVSQRTEAKYAKSHKPKRKTVPFRVIEGSKGKDDGDDNIPRFH